MFWLTILAVGLIWGPTAAGVALLVVIVLVGLADAY
jgi:hypothetical protein